MKTEIDPLGADILLQLWLETREMTFRDQLVAQHLPLANRLCTRFQNQGEPMDDLIRAGAMGLMKAVDRYDSQCRNKFTAFAIPVILGEIKAYFRHNGWDAMVPRKLQLSKLLLDQTVETLTQEVGRSPTVAEISEAAGLSEEEVFQTIEVDSFQQTVSLKDEPAADQRKQYTHIPDWDGEQHPSVGSLADETDLKVPLADMDTREQIVLYLKLYSGLSQSAIARRLGISRIHVSRLQFSGVAKLRLRLRECVRS
ncbi:MAG: hypothetical protein BZY80_01590 [SAR202 cluster bacterium Io17-Chloro-G2]|nr:MAG: hypothetical protein BZY80_01590 [SAR202 cluster bacterium Io17-Chloro-G2]